MEHDAVIYFRDQFREARARALRDAEAYQEILFSIERFGSALTGTVGMLGTYRKAIVDKAKASPLAEDIPQRHRAWHKGRPGPNRSGPPFVLEFPRTPYTGSPVS